MYNVDYYNNLIGQCDRNIRRINVGNGILLSCELVSFILCSGLPLDDIVFIMCVEAVIFQNIMYLRYGSKTSNYKLKNECLKEKAKILELKR